MAAYAVVAVLAAWPLPVHLSTHLLGDPSGDTGVYVWNLWHFRDALVEGRDPFRTTALFGPTGPADLGLHNYTAFLDLLSLPLQGALGVVGAFNVVYLVLCVLNGWAMFALARRVSGDVVAAWMAGGVFAFSAFLTARSTAHLSLVAAAPLPVLALLLLRIGEGRRVRDAALAGLTLAWALYCDPYYAVFCVLLAGAWVIHAQVEVVRGDGPPPRRLVRGLDVALAAVGLVFLAIAVTGGTELRVAGTRVALKSINTPALLLVVLGLARLVAGGPLAFRLRPAWPARTLATLGATAVLAASIPLAPFLGAIVRSVAAGEFVSPAIPWRSSPPGVDVIAFLMPNPNHAVLGEASRGWLQRLRADGFEENAAALGLVALAVVALAARRKDPLPRRFVFLAVVFALLALGPFVQVGGFNTRLPTPWALLRYVPVVGMVRSPTRFAVLALLAFAVLFACALAALRRRAGDRRRLVTAVVGTLLALELAAVPRPLFSARIPEIYGRVSADPRPVSVLVLPTGARDGTRSVGDFSAVTQFQQVAHGKPLLGGGYLSRVPERRIRACRSFPVLDALFAASGGEPVRREVLKRARASQADFLARSRLGYVVVDNGRASPELRQMAIHLLGLRPVAADGDFELLVPMPEEERQRLRRERRQGAREGEDPDE